ncbi:MAG: hypothetical protein V1911_02940 [Candidatus Micrarchaeota archaeon]
MGEVAVSFVLKMAIMIGIMMSVYYTMNFYADSIAKQQLYVHLKEVAEYVETNVVAGLAAVNEAGSNYTKRIDLPSLSKMYTVDLSCDETLNINATAPVTGRSYILKDDFSCNWMNASGYAFAGHPCLNVKRINATNVELTLGSDCEII